MQLLAQVLGGLVDHGLVAARVDTFAEQLAGGGDGDVDGLHTHHLLLADWERPYSKAQAFFPLKGEMDDKFWPPVGRVDNVAGDRHLVCTCPPIEAYQEAAE